MTEQLFFEDCYLREWESKIENVKRNGKQVVLAESAFYPEGGGQPTDKGFLYSDNEQYRVKKVKKKGSDVWHYLDKAGLVEGMTVKAELDWDRRYKHMRMHTALHLLSTVLLNEYDAGTAGNQIHKKYSRVDFEPFDPTKEDLNKIVEHFNEYVDEGREVKIYMVDRERIEEVIHNEERLHLIDRIPDVVKEIRVVEIEGLDKDPCGGTHVKNTKEIGHLKIRDTENKGKNVTRLIIELSDS